MATEFVLVTTRLVLRPVLEAEPADWVARLSASVHEDANLTGLAPDRVEQARRAMTRSAAAFRA